MPVRNIRTITATPATTLATTLAFALLMSGCEPEGASGETPSQPYTDFFTPIPESAVFPTDNPFSEEKRVLGEFLFWDPILSGGMNVSCASCHHPEFGWADGRDFSIGVDGMGLGPNRTGVLETPFHSPTVLNTAFTGIARTEVSDDFVSGPYFWDLRAATLEDQAIEPIRSEVEMRGSGFLEEEIMPELLARLAAIPQYADLFSAAFESAEPITETNLAQALATFQRTLKTSPTRFDRFLAGEETALTGPEVVGLNKFINGGCTDCHSGPLLSDVLIRENQPVQVDRPAVRTASLRNVERTAPYMHDGSRRTLRDAIALYEGRDDLGVTLEDDDFGDIENFLRTLTDDTFYRDVPPSVPSQLPVGGDIGN